MSVPACSYNLWFTLIMAGQGEQQDILEQVRKIPGVVKILDLPACRKYKINIFLPL